MIALQLHRLEPAVEGSIDLRRAEGFTSAYGHGVVFRFAANLLPHNHAEIYGWNTGIPAPFDETVQGRIYAPQGIMTGNHAFVHLKNPFLLRQSFEERPSLDAYRKHLCEQDFTKYIRDIKGFVLVGEIIRL